MAPLRRRRRPRGARPGHARRPAHRGVPPDRVARARHPRRRLRRPRACAARRCCLHTGWDRHFDTPAYSENAPYLTPEGVAHLAAQGVLLVGIDAQNIDDTSSATAGERPAHSTFLAHGIHIVEHLTNLGELPAGGALFTAVPPKFEGTGTFTVRAFAKVPA
ncbi:cyclase family protein [Microbacterium elymi]|uniref:cyclase family protein n=1 Tax=Microbacterium elymi TaxID=2909587 RepID=UPI00338E5801